MAKKSIYLSDNSEALLKRLMSDTGNSASDIIKDAIRIESIQNYCKVRISEGAYVCMMAGRLDLIQTLRLENGFTCITMKEDAYRTADGQPGEFAEAKDELCRYLERPNGWSLNDLSLFKLKMWMQGNYLEFSDFGDIIPAICSKYNVLIDMGVLLQLESDLHVNQICGHNDLSYDDAHVFMAIVERIEQSITDECIQFAEHIYTLKNGDKKYIMLNPYIEDVAKRSDLVIMVERLLHQEFQDVIDSEDCVISGYNRGLYNSDNTVGIVVSESVIRKYREKGIG